MRTTVSRNFVVVVVVLATRRRHICESCSRARIDRFFSRDLPTFSRIPHTRSCSPSRARARVSFLSASIHVLADDDARTGQGQARSRPTYRTDRRPALNFIHTYTCTRREVDSRGVYLRGIQNDVPMDQTAAIRRPPK